MLASFADLPSGMIAALFFILGVSVGAAINLWGIALVVAGCESSEPSAANSGLPAFPIFRRLNGPNIVPSPWWHFVPIAGHWLAKERGVFRGVPVGRSGIAAELGTGILFAGYALAYLVLECQQVTEVRPDDLWKYGRVFYHLVLIGLLAAATATDFRDYVIPDAITLPGTLIGVAAAGLSGQLQMIHVWVDWNQEIPGLQGPYLPAWLDAHRHLHGFAWSTAGAVVGAGITWIARFLSRSILGRESMGFGDVTLMAMIGSFLGWQPILLVFFLAPLCGLLVAPVTFAISRRAFLAYGPCLSAAAFGVLCSWKWLWLPTRKIFGDAQLLAILGAGALVVFVVLLGIIRRYQNLPARSTSP